MSRPTEEIISRIKKCLALSKSSFEGEAENALSLASKLMEQHGLSMSQIDMSDDGHIKEGGIVTEATKEWDMWPWEKSLARVIDNLLPVEHYFRCGWKKKALAFVGTESDAALAVEIYMILRAELKRISRDEPTPVDRRSFLTGCVQTLRNRAFDIKKKRESEAAKYKTPDHKRPETGTELMVVKQQDVQAWVKANLKLKTMNDRGSSTTPDAYQRGRTAGASINLNFHKAIGGEK